MARRLHLKLPDLRPHARELAGTMVRRLDAALFPGLHLRNRVRGKTVLITGASTGIGEALAYRLAAAGAQVLLSARSTEKLERVVSAIVDAGGQAVAYPCDIANPDDCERMAAEILAEQPGVDILVNNAGRSIRRPVIHSLDRFHDFERTMQLNYFGAIRLTMALLPQMRNQGGGQVINISTLGVQTLPARFSAYLASKGALEMWTQVAANELGHENIHFSLINFPLVRTPMIAPTEIYRYSPALTPEQAVDWICQAIITRQKRVGGVSAQLATLMHMSLPKLSEAIVNMGYQMTPESAAARGKAPRKPAGGDDYGDNVRPLRRRRR
ncbi:MAG: SDR family NAD(P)-dependent oxidoreductase [Alcanivorax sp.]|nr:SDR family NAD(P)-dependent oxidoreductase [Alcanivorax sp.]